MSYFKVIFHTVFVLLIFLNYKFILAGGRPRNRIVDRSPRQAWINVGSALSLNQERDSFSDNTLGYNSRNSVRSEDFIREMHDARNQIGNLYDELIGYIEPGFYKLSIKEKGGMTKIEKRNTLNFDILSQLAEKFYIENAKRIEFIYHPKKGEISPEERKSLIDRMFKGVKERDQGQLIARICTARRKSMGGKADEYEYRNYFELLQQFVFVMYRANENINVDEWMYNLFKIENEFKIDLCSPNCSNGD